MPQQSDNNINRVQVLGVRGHEAYDRLLSNVTKALDELSYKGNIEEVFDLEVLMRSNIKGIPALRVDGQIIVQQSVPDVEHLKRTFRRLFSSSNKFVTMKNILVPTDFSETAEEAFRFAQELAIQHNANLTTAHFFNPVVDMDYYPKYDPMEEWQKVCESRMSEFVQLNLLRKGSDVLTKVKTNQLVAPGFPAEEIVNLSATPDVDLIVMGTTGERGWVKKVFGSVSAFVAQNAHCPVMLIPHDAVYSGFKNVLYATDYLEKDENLLQEAIDLLRITGAKIHLVHVMPNQTDDYVEHFASSLKPKMLSNDMVTFQMATIENNTVQHGLDEYAKRHHMDLVVMATRHRNLIENLFHYSITKKMAFTTQFPLLVMHFGE